MNTTQNSQALKQGEVYLADVYFSATNQYKRRPVIIVSNERAIDLVDVMTAPVTSQRARNEFDVDIEKWREAGLAYPSIARTAKLLTIDQSKLLRKLGDLDDNDLANVLEKCRQLF
ncbi:type II toxin-antitoxin system PemK/MazF family toxin [Alicyclobacillus tolerans]|uniref:type II toxin-antitoxin system PemK/MazF family toxin n=1 Tax=Alicyclobacillus tolerans TaxID=90970 RepID=UPI001F3DC746|nr:type II toxin-antitoxin system PemK/MazF family toxin [Alicyclobacillus tolerans]MCF8567671.1 type II toxin-antitoxin system PemK/MazF family toxin [Alicyclobacillus tolerans]